MFSSAGNVSLESTEVNFSSDAVSSDVWGSQVDCEVVVSVLFVTSICVVCWIVISCVVVCDSEASPGSVVPVGWTVKPLGGCVSDIFPEASADR